MHLSAIFAVSKTLTRWMFHLGGPGLILIGLVDNSFIPLPGGMDVFTILLAATHRDPWWYYAIMATIGSLVGGYAMYKLGKKGGKEALEKKISKKRADKVYNSFERYGFWSIVVGCILPPPVPIVPFLLAPGALKYPRFKFLSALFIGRGARYTLVAYLGSRYGHGVLHWLFRYYKPLLYFVIGVGVIGGLFALYYWKRHKHENRAEKKAEEPAEKAA